MTGAYDEIVSLGYDCRLAFNLRRTFGNPRAFPFDWWVTPLPALAAFLREPSVPALYDPAQLLPVTLEGKLYAIRSARYDIELHHEFPRDKEGMVIANWPAHVARAQERTQFLLDRMLAIPAGARILFVRSTKGIERRALGHRFPDLIAEIRQALDALFPGLAAELLLIDPPSVIKADGVTNLWVRDQDKSDWRGTPDLWSAKLLGAGIGWSGRRSEDRVEASPEADHSLPKW